MAQAQDLDDLRLAIGQQHGAGLLAVERQAVALVGTRVFRRGQERGRRNEPGECRGEVWIEHGARGAGDAGALGDYFIPRIRAPRCAALARGTCYC